VQLRDAILNEVTRYYYERRRLQVEMMDNVDQDGTAKIKDELRLQELTAYIDALTGVYIQPYLNEWTPGKEFPVKGKLSQDQRTMVLNFRYSYNDMSGGSKMYTHRTDPAILTIRRRK